MRKRSASLAIIALLLLLLLLLLGLGGGVWITSLDDIDQATSTGEPEPPVVERPAPTLVATAQEVEAKPLPAPAQPKTVEKPALRVRVVSEDEPVGGAVVSIDYLSEDDMVAVTAPCTTDMDGRCVLPVDASAFPLAIVVRGSASMIPVALTLDAVPEDEVVVSLRVGRSLEVHTIDMDRNPMPGIPLVLFSVGLWSRGNAGMVHQDSGWVFEDSRRITTGEKGVAVVHGLDPESLFHAYAPGYGSPNQIIPAPEIPQPKHDAVAPGPGKRLVVMLAPLRIVWARAVDSETGARVPAASFSRFHAPDRTPSEQMRLMRAVTLYTARGLLRLSGDMHIGDYFREHVVRDPGEDVFQCGPFQVRAPGYQTTEALLEARRLPEARSGPTLVRLARVAGTEFTTITISLRTTRRRVRTDVRLRRGRKTLFHRAFNSEAAADIEMSVVPGDYELRVGGNSLGMIRVDTSAPVKKSVNLDELPSLRIKLALGSDLYSGRGNMFMQSDTGPGSTLGWYLGLDEIAFEEGLSPHFIVPPKKLVVAAGSSDGKRSDFVRVSVAEAEHTEVSVRVP